MGNVAVSSMEAIIADWWNTLYGWIKRKELSKIVAKAIIYFSSTWKWRFLKLRWPVEAQEGSKLIGTNMEASSKREFIRNAELINQLILFVFSLAVGSIGKAIVVLLEYSSQRCWRKRLVTPLKPSWASEIIWNPF